MNSIEIVYNIMNTYTGEDDKSSSNVSSSSIDSNSDNKGESYVFSSTGK